MTAGWNARADAQQPADQHAHRRTHAAKSSTRGRSTPPRVCSGTRRRAVRRRGARGPGRRRHQAQARQRPHRRHQFRLGLLHAEGAKPDHMNGEMRLDAAQRGLIAGRLRAERNSADMLDWPLRGQMQMATGELGFITLYVPEIDRASGHFDANLELRGNARATDARAASSSSPSAELDLYQLNLALRALEMEARIVSNNLEFSSTRQGRRGHARELGKNRMARRPALRRHPSRRRKPAPGRRARGAHRRLARSRLPHRGPRHLRQGRGQTTAGAHPARRPHQRRAAVGGRSDWWARPKRSEKDPFRVTSEITHDAGRQGDHRNLRPLRTRRPAASPSARCPASRRAPPASCRSRTASTWRWRASSTSNAAG